MATALEQHQIEIQRNLDAWHAKPLLQRIYARFYQRITGLIDPALPGQIVEIGSGIGNLKAHYPGVLATDLFPNPWLDMVCDGYDLPFRDRTISHLILFDVFHHLRAPNAFLREARRVLSKQGRLILFEPFISLSSGPVYGLFHHEPVWAGPIDTREELARPRDYYAAQGNATRLFWKGEFGAWPADWNVFHREAFAGFAYLLSGGFSKPPFYPSSLLPFLETADRALSLFPRLFGARCLVGLCPR